MASDPRPPQKSGGAIGATRCASQFSCAKEHQRAARLRSPPSHTSPRHTCRGLLANTLVRSQWLKEVSRVVVKLGTGVLTDHRKQPDPAQMEQLVRQISEQRKKEKEIIVVSSGAVGAGMGVLGFEKRPN